MHPLVPTATAITAAATSGLSEFKRRRFLATHFYGQLLYPSIEIDVLDPPFTRAGCYDSNCHCSVVYYVHPDSLEAIYKHGARVKRHPDWTLDDIRRRHNPPQYGICICSCMGTFINKST